MQWWELVLLSSAFGLTGGVAAAFAVRHIVKVLEKKARERAVLEEQREVKEWFEAARAREDRKAAILAFAQAGIQAAAGIAPRRWVVVMDGRDRVMVPCIHGGQFGAFTIEAEGEFGDSPWGYLKYGYDEAHDLAILFAPDASKGESG